MGAGTVGLDTRGDLSDTNHMPARLTQTITETLKEAIRKSDMSLRYISIATGVQRASLIRFMRGDQSLRLDVADKLAEFFDIKCRAMRKY